MIQVLYMLQRHVLIMVAHLLTQALHSLPQCSRIFICFEVCLVLYSSSCTGLDNAKQITNYSSNVLFAFDHTF